MGHQKIIFISEHTIESFFCIFLQPLLNIFCFCYVYTISVLYRAHLCMKCSLGIFNFLTGKVEAYFDSVCNPWWLSGQDSTCQCRRCGFDSYVEKIPWRSRWQLTPVFLPMKSCGQRNLAGYSPWGFKRVRRNVTIIPLSPLLCALKRSPLISGPGIT